MNLSQLPFLYNIFIIHENALRSILFSLERTASYMMFVEINCISSYVVYFSFWTFLQHFGNCLENICARELNHKRRIILSHHTSFNIYFHVIANAVRICSFSAFCPSQWGAVLMPVIKTSTHGSSEILKLWFFALLIQ